MNNEDRKMQVIDENGKETEMFILFTTSLESTNKNYIFYVDPKDEKGNVYVSSYDESNHLSPVTNDDEWNELESVFNDFMDEQNNNNSCSSCSGNCGENASCDCQSCDGHCKEN